MWGAAVEQTAANLEPLAALLSLPHPLCALVILAAALSYR